MRQFEQTHPWLQFRLDLRSAPIQLWLLLGEAQSKSQHVVGTPLLPTVQQQFQSLYLAKGVHATTAIEGNTLTEEQARAHVEGRLVLPPSQQYLQRELENMVNAFNEVARTVFEERRTRLTPDDALAYNARILADLPLPPEVVPGVIRRIPVTVNRYPGAPVEDCAHLVDRLCAWLNDEFVAPNGFEIGFGILKAIVAHVYIAWIHPFGDGNGRTARLIEFQILVGAGVPTTAAHLLSNHYCKTRAEYYRQLDYAHKTKGDLLPFIEYALRGFIDGLREQIQTLRRQQLEVGWRDYVHSVFRDQRSDGDKRKRDLVLAISQRDGATPVDAIRLLTPQIAALYAKKSDKTLSRDIRDTVAMGLLETTPAGLRARKEIMSAFMTKTTNAAGSGTGGVDDATD